MSRVACCAAVIALVLSACTDSLDENVDVGVLAERAGNTPMVDVPSTVRPGEPFIVTITTVMFGSCTGFDSTEARVTEAGALITPYDEFRDGPCTRELGEISHDVTLHFDVPGTRYVRIQGRSNPESGVDLDVERRITVAY